MMRKNQVCIADDPKAHTTKFVDTEKLVIGYDENKNEIYLGEILANLTQRLEVCEKDNKVLKKTNADLIKTVALLNNKQKRKGILK